MHRGFQHSLPPSLPMPMGRAVALAALLIAAALAGGCSKKDDTVTQAAKADVAQGVPAPSIEETKAIAEQAYIYGFPMIAAYKAMHEFNVDKASPQAAPAPARRIHRATRPERSRPTRPRQGPA